MSNASRKLMQVQATAAPPADTGDPYWKYVSLLLDGDGTSDDDNNTFTDSSSNAATITETGSVVQGSFSPYGDNWSNYFDSGANLLKVTDSTDFDLGTTWTVEAWVHPNAANASKIFGTRNGSGNMWELIIYTSGKKFAFEGYGANSTSGPQLSSSTFEPNQWYHVAVVTSSGATKLYVNGVLEINYSNSLTWSTAYGPWIGGTSAFSEYAFDGYVSNLRVVKGTAVYTGAFTPPTEPLTAITNTVLLTCQSNRFVDNSTSSHTITTTGTPKATPFSPFKDSDARTLTADGGSGFVNGSGNYLSLSNSTDLKPGASGAFSAEFWYYPTGTGTNRQIMGTMTVNSYPSNIVGWDFVESGSNSNIAFRWGSPSYQDTGSSSAIMKINQWNHVAICRDAEATPTLSLFLNGTRTFSTTSNTSISDTSSGTFYVGYGTYTGSPHDPALGNISDARVMKGSTAYDPTQSTLTIPTSPLTAVTNTKLLLNFQDAGIFDRSGINNLDTIGDARLVFAPIYGTGSLAFDGTGDYLSMPVEPHFDFGTADFTIESWVNLNATGQFNPVVYLGRDTHTGVACDISSSNNPRILAHIGGSWTTVATGSTALEKNRWYHLAFVRNGSSFKIYVDGVEDASATNSGSITAATSDSNSVAQIGYLRTNGGSDRHLDGYLDDLRVTNGVARYTSNFTPPTEIDLSADTHREYVTLFLDGDGTVNGQNNTFTDSSTNSAAITEAGQVVQGVFSPYGDNWSVFFDGSNDYLELPADSNYVFGTGDFTIEAWIYTDGSDFFSIFQNCPFNSSAATDDYFFGVNSLGKLEFSRHGGTASCASANGAVSFNEWHHIAVTRTSSVMTVWLDGASAGTSTDSNLISYNINQNVAHTIGWRVTPNYGGGYLSNLRVLNGTALYTTGFTVPTSPLTAITNTAFLGLQSNRFIDNSTVDNSITAANSIAISRFSPFESNKPYDITADGGSAYFDGSSDLASSRSVNWSTHTNITLEAWVYPTSLSSNTAHVLMGTASGATGYTAFYLYSDGRIGIGITGVNEIASSSGAVIDNEWQHVAAVKSGSTTTLYVNGTSVASATTAVWSNNSAVVRVGRANTTERLYGYMSDVRVVLGTAIVPSTLSTSPLTAVTNTELLLNFQDSAIPDLSGLNNIDTVGNAKVAGTDPTKYGSNAMQFDGAGDYLTFDHSLNEISFGTGDFTIEGWFYIQSGDEYPYAFDFRNTGSQAAPALYFYNYGNGSIDYYVSGASRILGTSAGNDVWQHIAVCRSGTSTKMFVNGTQSGSTYTDSTNYSAYSGNIGIKYDNVRPFKGFIDDFRITKGYARYTSNFTAPDAALKKF